MPENSTVTHVKVNERYRMTIEQAAAGARNQKGWKIEVNEDTIEQVAQNITLLKKMAEQWAPEVPIPIKEEKAKPVTGKE